LLITVLYQACIHPEQYSHTLPKSALKVLYEKIHSVTTEAASVLGDSSKFPDDWLFSYRWGKSRTRGKKGGKEENNVLPNGEIIKHITVGGRTSAVVESRQKKIRGNGEGGEVEEEEPSGKKKRRVKEEDEKATSKMSAKGKVIPAAKKTPQFIKEEQSVPKRRPVSSRVDKDVEEEKLPTKKQRVSGRAIKGTSNSTPTRKSSRSKA